MVYTWTEKLVKTMKIKKTSKNNVTALFLVCFEFFLNHLLFLVSCSSFWPLLDSFESNFFFIFTKNKYQHYAIFQLFVSNKIKSKVFDQFFFFSYLKHVSVSQEKNQIISAYFLFSPFMFPFS